MLREFTAANESHKFTDSDENFSDKEFSVISTVTRNQFNEMLTCNPVQQVL